MADGGTATVLVVDDDEAVAEVYATQLEESYEVLTARDGATALELVTGAVDVVLLDRRMHGLSGREVLERVREREFDCGVVMVTAVDPGFDIVDMGFDEYLVKPVERDELLQVVAETLDRLDARATLREYHAVAAKVATLRVEKTAAELADSDAYDRLVDRFERIRDELERTDGADRLPFDPLDGSD